MRDDQGLMDDVMTLGGNLLGNLLGARHELKAQMRQRVEHMARNLDLVSREEFDAAFAMLAKARAAQEDLQDRLAALENRLGLSRAKATVKTGKKRLPSVKQDKRRHRRA